MKTRDHMGRRLDAYESALANYRPPADFNPDKCRHCDRVRGVDRPLVCRLDNGATHWSCGAPAPAGWTDPQQELHL